MSYICSKCKKEYTEQVKFCNECGSPVEATPALESVPAPEAAPTETAAPAPEAAPAVPAQKKTNVWGIIGGIIVVLGIVFGIFREDMLEYARRDKISEGIQTQVKKMIGEKPYKVEPLGDYRFKVTVKDPSDANEDIPNVVIFKWDEKRDKNKLTFDSNKEMHKWIDVRLCNVITKLCEKDFKRKPYKIKLNDEHVATVIIAKAPSFLNNYKIKFKFNAKSEKKYDFASKTDKKIWGNLKNMHDALSTTSEEEKLTESDDDDDDFDE